MSDSLLDSSSEYQEDVVGNFSLKLCQWKASAFRPNHVHVTCVTPFSITLADCNAVNYLRDSLIPSVLSKTTCKSNKRNEKHSSEMLILKCNLRNLSIIPLISFEKRLEINFCCHVCCRLTRARAVVPSRLLPRNMARYHCFRIIEFFTEVISFIQ